MKARIYIVDDELMAIQYFKYLLQEAKIDCEVIGEAMNGVKAIPEILKLQPDIVFADISMPVMDGLAMAEEVLKENKKQKIVILTSYRDFDYAKRGMNIGVTDYILKNELSEQYLQELINKIMQDSLKVKKEQHLIVEHNIRDFLLADSFHTEDHIYEQKPFQRYALISIVKQPKISIKLSVTQEHQRADCFEIENLIYPEGISCRAIAEMAEGEWCGVFFIDGSVSDSSVKLKETAQILLKAFEKYCKDIICLISDPMNHFLKLHEIYIQLKKLIGYAYAYDKQQILRMDEVKKNITEFNGVEQCLDDLERQLEDENQDKVIDTLQKILKMSKSSRDIWEYTEDLRHIYQLLKKYVNNRKLNQDIFEVTQDNLDVETIEMILMQLVHRIFEELQQSKQNQYTFYIISAMEFIHKNYDKDISIPDIANAVQISEGHLRKCFKQETNTKIVDYLLEYRLNRAKNLMKNGERRIDQVWQKTGFTSSQYFSFVFKRNEGMTPSEYIKQISKR